MRYNTFLDSLCWVVRLYLLLLFLAVRASAQTAPDSNWPTYGNDPGGTRYSTAKQIDRNNVTQLKVAWTFHTGAFPHDEELDHKAAFETTPILVDGKLFLTTPYNHVFAVNPETGEKLWEFDAKLELPYGASEVTSRGVSAWRDSSAKAGQACALRIFMGTLDARLIALDGDTGRPCMDFGQNGEVDLGSDVKLRDPGDYQVTSAPAIYKDLVITGSSIGDNRAVTLERGIVRAFDARTGKLRWTWDPIPWAMNTNPRTGAGNAWSTLSVDLEHGLVFVPTGSASPDYYGGIRKGDNKWANSVVALRASTGEVVWGFQVVHHDLWDYDVASQPALFTWKEGTPAVAITTKMGRVFVLNRLTGAPLIPVEERPVQKSDIPGEEVWPTQPASISLVPEKLTLEDAWGKDAQERQWCTDKMKAVRFGDIYTPPSVEGTLVYPSNVGGVNWGSAAYDPARHLLFMDTNRLPILVRLIPRDKFDEARKSASQEDRLHGEFARQTGAPFAMFRTPLLAPSGLPCNAPPWGTVAALDVFSGKKIWDVPLGSFIPGMNTGTVTLGGPMATAGGLVFTAAAMDNYIRAFDAETGKEVWKYELPAGGQATPMTYTLKGKQYLVIAAGGHGKLEGTKQGDSVVAFTLP
jgi:quinoprotein glucose dehydrogenase